MDAGWGLVVVTITVFAVGWITSVERRLTQLQSIAKDIHAIREMLTPLSELVSVPSALAILGKDRRKHPRE